MKLWKITPAPEVECGYIRHMIVRAKTKAKALKLFKKEIGWQASDYNFLHIYDQIKEISIDGDEEILCVDFLE